MSLKLKVLGVILFFFGTFISYSGFMIFSTGPLQFLSGGNLIIANKVAPLTLYPLSEALTSVGDVVDPNRIYIVQWSATGSLTVELFEYIGQNYRVLISKYGSEGKIEYHASQTGVIYVKFKNPSFNAIYLTQATSKTYLNNEFYNISIGIILLGIILIIADVTLSMKSIKKIKHKDQHPILNILDIPLQVKQS